MRMNIYSLHALFNKCYDSDKTFQQIWDAILKIDAPIPPKNSFDETGGIEFFAWQTPKQLSDLSPAYKKMLKTSAAPVFKLSNKKIYSPDESLRIGYLFATIEKLK